MPQEGRHPPPRLKTHADFLSTVSRRNARQRCLLSRLRPKNLGAGTSRAAYGQSSCCTNHEPARPPTSSAVGPSLRREDKFLAALAYVTCIPAIFFVLVEPYKRNRFVRFHSFQSIFLAVAAVLVAVAMRILYSLFALIPRVGYLFAWLFSAVLLLGMVYSLAGPADKGLARGKLQASVDRKSRRKSLAFAFCPV